MAAWTDEVSDVGRTAVRNSNTLAGIGANAEGESQDGDGGEAGRLAQHA